MTKVDRRLIADGDWYEVTCAVRSDGVSSPTADLLDELEEGMWADPDAEALPDEWQPKFRRRLLAHIEQLATDGELPDSAYNRLDDGIWEIKVDNVRVSFFDTDGEGNWSAKSGETVSKWDGSNKHLLPEDFDPYIRLGHTFPKTGQKTEASDLTECSTVRDEDVSHDQRVADEEIAGGA